MSANRVISAICNYREVINNNENKQVLFIPSIFDNDQFIFVSFIHFFTENKFFQSFVNRWASSINYSWGTLLDDFHGELEKFQMLMSILQGTIESIQYPIETPEHTINKENIFFANKVLKMINTGEKILYKLLKREKFLTQKSRFVSFDQLVTMLQSQEPRLMFNQVALYSQLAMIVEKFGTSQLKAEYNEIMKELKVWIKAELF